MTTEGGGSDAVKAVQEDIAKLRRLTTGSKELDVTTQVLGRIGSILGELDRRVRQLEERGTKRPSGEDADE